MLTIISLVISAALLIYWGYWLYAGDVKNLEAKLKVEMVERIRMKQHCDYFLDRIQQCKSYESVCLYENLACNFRFLHRNTEGFEHMWPVVKRVLQIKREHIRAFDQHPPCEFTRYVDTTEQLFVKTLS